MTKSIAGLFPGQGSQSVGMGADFYHSTETGRSIFAKADAVLGYSLSKLCLEGPLEELTLTMNSQPAILVVSYISYLQAEIPLTAAAGHSLGEYTALVAAGALEFEDAVSLVHRRGRYMQEAVAPGQGKMLAVMGPSEEEIRQTAAEIDAGVIEIANLNCPGQTVVAGDLAGADAFAEKIAAAGAKVIPLNVSAPFHCSLMKPAAEKLAKDLDATTFAAPKFPVYANVNAKPVASAAEVRERLKEQVCGSVRWTESMVNLIEGHKIELAVEFGPGAVLSKLLKRINSAVARQEVFNSQSLAKARAAVSAA